MVLLRVDMLVEGRSNIWELAKAKKAASRRAKALKTNQHLQDTQSQTPSSRNQDSIIPDEGNAQAFNDGLASVQDDPVSTPKQPEAGSDPMVGNGNADRATDAKPELPGPTVDAVEDFLAAVRKKKGQVSHMEWAMRSASFPPQARAAPSRLRFRLCVLRC